MGRLPTHLQQELSYVRDHCMMPPYPWGHVVYHDFIEQHVVGVPGDFAEFGVGQGGTSLFLARLAKRHGRKFLAVDSFEGLPQPDLGKDNHYFVEGDYRPTDGRDNYERFMDYKSHYDVDETLHVVKGFFSEVEIPPEFGELAFVHLDSDLYSSVYDSLEKVWDRIPAGGVVAVDDFFHHAQGPARAVSDFFRVKAGQSEPPLMFVVPTYAVLIVKGRSACIQVQATTGTSPVAGGPRDGSGAGRTPLPSHIMYSPRALDGNYYSFTLLRRCGAFVRAAEASVQRASEAHARAVFRGDASKEGLLRVRLNAEAFLSFLLYSDTAARSGNDILRYLLPLEDLFDISQGSLCGVSGERRRVIEIAI